MKSIKLAVAALGAIFVFGALPVTGQPSATFMQQAIEQFRAKNYTEAERLFGECIRVAPKEAECFYRRGLLRKLHIGYGVALEDFNAALAILPTNHILLTARGKLYHALKRPDDGMADLNKAVLMKPDHGEAYKGRGDIYREKGSADLAISEYTQAVKFDPKDDISYMWLGSLYKGKGDLPRALAEYTNAINAKPGVGTYYYNRGSIYMDQDKQDLAEADFNRAVQLDASLTTIVESTKRVARLKKAAPVLASIANSQPPAAPAEAARNAGWQHYTKKEYDLALVQLNKAIGLDPNNHWGYNYRSRVFEGMGQLDKAVIDINKAISLRTPLDSGYLRERAGLYLKQGKTTLALTEVNKIIAGETKPNAFSLLLRGKIYAKMGNKDQARADLSQAVQLNQYLKEAQEELAKL